MRRERAWRIASFVVGLLLIAGPLSSPLETWAVDGLLLLHLLQDSVLAEIAPLLVLLGLTPALRDRLRARGARRLRARYTLPVWLAAWYGTHAARFYEWALRNEWPLTIEHAILIAGGLLLWWPLVAGRLSAPAAIAYLGAGFVASSVLGLVLIFASTPLYPYYETAERPWGLSPMRDQSLGGVVLNAGQTLVFVAAIAWYARRLRRLQEI